MTVDKVLLIFLLFCPVAASSEKSSTNTAQAAYKLALNKIVTGWQPLLKGQSISFLEVSEEESGDKQSIAKLIKLDTNGEEIVKPMVGTNNQEEDEFNWETSVLVNPARFPANAKLIRETETTWVFSIPSLVKANIDDATGDVDSNRINKQLTSALVSELTVSKQSPRFISLKTYSKRRFKPAPLVEVSKFNVRIEYTQAWQNGPWVTESISRTLKGKYAIFVSVNEFSLKTYRSFHLVN
ncbi:hypothetical protein [Aliikangiella coralliicola]|uniref:Outer membrane lipoprotein-sorting protein n=1 Tax=Aliikangiella coralliicola TaxID=2592383 RepID=A0A545U7F9_9GAMM|nr:hypothetical protein [Aliikangiella coralliicola]TQV85407.1 hypothetical protein FLL46_19775 [Aliikangiella coralliicola]